MRGCGIDASDAIDLREVRHPLLVANGVRVVENDVRVRGGRALVISGPNAGGKTVALKCLGLAVWLARSGLPIPAAPESRIEHVLLRARRQQKHAPASERLRAAVPVRMHLDRGEVAIVQPGATQRAIVQRKAERADQVQPRSGIRRKPHHVPGALTWGQRLLPVK